MRSLALAATAATVLLGVLPAAAAPGTGPQWWWRSPAIQAELRLTPAQVAALDAAYRRSLPRRVALRRALDASERRLRRLLEDGTADESTAAALIAHVEDARGRRNRARTLLLIEMYRILAPVQRVRLVQLVPGSNPIQSAAQTR